jgi:hypothetical protein
MKYKQAHTILSNEEPDRDCNCITWELVEQVMKTKQTCLLIQKCAMNLHYKRISVIAWDKPDRIIEIMMR